MRIQRGKGIGRYVNWYAVRAVGSAVRAARRIYGPFGLHTLPLQLGLSSTDGDPAREVVPGGEAVDIVLQRILTARTLLAAGLVTLLVQATLVFEWRWDWVAGWMYSTLERGLYVMFVAPFLVVLVVGLLVATARPELRRATLRAGRAALGAAAFTLGYVAVLAVLALDFRDDGPVARFLGDQPDQLAEVVSTPVGIVVAFVLLLGLTWFSVFFFASIYLAQRNGLSRHRALPLLPPLVVTGVTVSLMLLGLDGSEGIGGWREVLHRFGPPLAVGVISALEIRILRRKYGYTFRTPVDPGAYPGSRASSDTATG